MTDDRECKCVQRHVPLPQHYYMIDVAEGQVECVCPTTFYNVQQLAAQYVAHDGVPPGAVTKHYSKYVRDLVFDLFNRSNV
jgi:hypothetical protein